MNMAQSWDKARRSTALDNRDMDAEFDKFLDESLSDESPDHRAPVASDISPRKSKSFNPKRRPWWDDGPDKNDTGVSDIVKRMMKSKSEPAVEMVDTQEPKYVSILDKPHQFATSISRDSLEGSHTAGEFQFKEGDNFNQGISSNLVDDQDEDISSNTSNPDESESLQSKVVGVDTMDEMRDKMKFFQDLYGDQTGTLDFEKLNKQIDTELTLKTENKDKKSQENSEPESAAANYLDSQSEVIESSEHKSYSDDRFEDVDSDQQTNFIDSGNDDSQQSSNTENNKEDFDDDYEKNINADEERQGTTMLSKVSLMDSLDSVTGTEFAAQRHKLLKAKQGSHLGATTEEHQTADNESDSIEPSTSSHDNSLAQGTSTLAELTDLQLALADASRLPMGESGTMSILPERDEEANIDEIEGMTLTKTKHGQAETQGFDTKAPAAHLHIEVDLPRFVAAESSRSSQSHSSDDESKHSNDQQLSATNTDNDTADEEERHSASEIAHTNEEHDNRGFALEAISKSSDEDSPPTDSLRSITEVANARRAEAIKAIQERLIREQTPKKKRGSNIPRVKPITNRKETPSKIKSTALRTSTPNSKSPGNKLHITRSSLSTSSPANNKAKKVNGKQTKTVLKSSVTPKTDSNYMKTFTKRNLGKDLQNASQILSNEEETHKNEITKNSSISLQRELDLQSRLQEMQVKLNKVELTEKHLLEKLDSTNLSWQNRLETQRIKFSEKCKSLEQELFLLRSKMNPLQGGRDVTKDSDSDKALMQTLDEQEVLLRGYQQENERMCSEIKYTQENRKQTESRMFAENQKYASEIAQLREKLDDFEAQRRHASADGDSSTALASKKAAQYENQIKYYKDKEAELQNEIGFLQGENDVLHRRIKLLEKDRVGLLESDVKKQMSELEAKHHQEISRLQKKLTWYAKNQDLLDGNQELLTRKTQDIEELQRKLDTLQQDQKSTDESRRTVSKESIAKDKRTKDLERQVKEMEKIISQRHPNSLPALIFAAADTNKTECDQTKQKRTEENSRKQYLEKQLNKLENQLKEKDNELLMKMRSTEQKYNAMSLQYQEHVTHLEKQLKNGKPYLTEKTVPDILNEKTNLPTCEKCIDNERKLLQVSKQKGRQSRDFARDAEILELKKAVRTLQEERESRLAKSFDQKHQSSAKQVETSLELPKYVVSQLTTLSEEKDKLRDELEDCRHENIKLKERHHAELVARDLEIETSSNRIKKSIEKLEKQHIDELERLKVDFALEHSSSKVAELSGKVASQDVVIQHLKKKLSVVSDQEQLITISKTREEDLRHKIAHLEDQLSEAESQLSPEMQDFKQLKSKIIAIERRHAERERNLKDIINSKVSMSVDSRLNEDRLKQALKSKADEVEHFREQLDNILEVLNELKRQGVVLPFPS